MFLIDNFVLEKEKVFLIFYIFYTYNDIHHDNITVYSGCGQ